MALITKIRNKTEKIYTECKSELVENYFQYRKLASGTCVATAISCMAVPAFADGISDLSSKATKVITDLYNASFGIVTVLAALLLVIAFIVRMTAGQQKAAQATSWIVRIIVCYLCINCIGLLFSVLDGIAEGSAFSGGKS